MHEAFGDYLSPIQSNLDKLEAAHSSLYTLYTIRCVTHTQTLSPAHFSAQDFCTDTVTLLDLNILRVCTLAETLSDDP
jgi:hypothetical protein